MSDPKRFISTVNIFLAVLSVPVQCASYCYYYYSYYYYTLRQYCDYYYDSYYYYYYSDYYTSYSSSALTIAGAVIGSIVGLVIFISIVCICVQKVCNKPSHRQIAVQPSQMPVSYINPNHYGYFPQPAYPAPAYPSSQVVSNTE
ncbi:uncharacterized protein LOC128160605 [Crassostrea angulata]|uniref:uncharacterized protein LOC128160605 n=1 Tax=Magallana angulata TaxID=2784310 RepID=UPI0022B138D1|nr:uncharacterized protein LOC128160605 [Crassostrea angulata]